MQAGTGGTTMRAGAAWSDGARRNRNVHAGRNRRSDGVRILHTSDWHLGRSFHRVSLLDAQAAYLDHLVATVREREVDVVLVAGDVYDRAVPPLTAVELFDRALHRPPPRASPPS